MLVSRDSKNVPQIIMETPLLPTGLPDADSYHTPAVPPWALLALALGTSPGSMVIPPPLPACFLTAITSPHELQHHVQEQISLS